MGFMPSDDLDGSTGDKHADLRRCMATDASFLENIRMNVMPKTPPFVLQTGVTVGFWRAGTPVATPPYT